METLAFQNFIKYLFTSGDADIVLNLDKSDILEVIEDIIPDVKNFFSYDQDWKAALREAHSVEEDGLTIYNWDGSGEAMSWIAFDHKHEKAINYIIKIINANAELYPVTADDIEESYRDPND